MNDMSDLSVYADAVAQEIAARYGCVVAPTAVQVIARGRSGLPEARWDAEKREIVYVDGSSNHWRNGIKSAATQAIARRRRVMGLNAPIFERRAQVSALHAQGRNVREMMALLDLSERMVRDDLRALTLAPHPIRHQDRPEVKARLAVIAERIAAGAFASEIVEALQRLDGRKFTTEAVRDMARNCLGLAVPVPTRRGSKHTADSVRSRLARERREAVAALIDQGVGFDDLVAQVDAPLRLIQADIRALGSNMAQLRRKDAGSRAKLAAERQALAADLARQGLCAQDIAARVGVTLRSVQRFLTAEKIELRKIALELRRGHVARAMADRGATVAALARDLGVDERTIYGDLKALGLQTPMAVLPEGLIMPGRGASKEARQVRADRQRAVEALVGQSMSVTQIATKLGVRRALVCKDVAALGLKGQLPRADRRTTAWRVAQAARREKIAELKRAGRSYREIAEAVGMHQSGVWRILSEMGLTAASAMASLGLREAA